MKFTANLLVTKSARSFQWGRARQGLRKGPLFSATRLGGRRRIWANYLGGYAASREQAMRYFKARYIGPSN